MRFSTRAFLSSFVPFAVLLAASFWSVRAAVIATVRDGLRASVRDNQLALTRERTLNEALNRKLLQGTAENPTLKAGLQLLMTERDAKDQARSTVQDQLSEIGDSLSFDFLMVSDAHGQPLAAVVRDSGGFTPVNTILQRPPSEGVFSTDDRIYEVRSSPIYEAGEQVATLTVGARFEITRVGVPAVLLHKGSVVTAQMRDLAPAQIEQALRSCGAEECEIRIQDQVYLSLPVGLNKSATGGDYSLRTLQNVDAASAPLQAVLQKLFLVGGLLAIAAMCGISAMTSRSIARPLANMADQLKRSAATGELPEFPIRKGGPREIRDLMQGFNDAAAAIREGRTKLTRAYVQFVGSLAQALDARDAYTAGHSRRVSEYSCAIAKAMNLPPQQVENIRVGALLHDVGKIGISDLVLQKPGRLTPEETEMIKQHPAIGRRILEKVQGLEEYLDVVELHHENWDGTGYPHGLKAEETPLEARIVKVADAYDAMTSDRPYRRGKTHLEAMEILRAVSGSEVDSAVVEVFAGLGEQRKEWVVLNNSRSLHSLATAISTENGLVPTMSAPQPHTVPADELDRSGREEAKTS